MPKYITKIRDGKGGFKYFYTREELNAYLKGRNTQPTQGNQTGRQRGQSVGSATVTVRQKPIPTHTGPVSNSTVPGLTVKNPAKGSGTLSNIAKTAGQKAQEAKNAVSKKAIEALLKANSNAIKKVTKKSVTIGKRAPKVTAGVGWNTTSINDKAKHNDDSAPKVTASGFGWTATSINNKAKYNDDISKNHIKGSKKSARNRKLRKLLKRLSKKGS